MEGSKLVELTRIYTRGGDRGKTSLSDGSRVAKHHIRVEAYGTVDEANAVIGMARLHVSEKLDEVLSRVQNDLFDCGADLATPIHDNPEHPPLRMTDAQVQWVEEQIDKFNSNLGALKSFILPGGSVASAYLHQARTVSRRAERLTSALAESEEITASALKYLNRLSDLMFVLARVENANGVADVLWVPGKNR